MNQEQNIDILIAKSISGNANAEEIKELEAWEKETPANEQLVQKNRKAWQHALNYMPENLIQSDKSLLTQLYSQYLSKQIHRSQRRTFLYKLAAILAFPVALAAGWYLSDTFVSPANELVQLTYITSPKGHVSKSILPDGTQVWINTGSTISYDISRFNKNSREVYLDGEAYFEVTSNAEKQFFVSTAVSTVNVTGTSFNVKAYSGEANYETVLAEGSIFLQFMSETSERITMKPGQRLIYNWETTELEISEVDAVMFTAWRNGELLFKDATLNDLITELERIYDIEFHLQSQELGEFRFRGMFTYNSNLIEALEKIKRTSGIDYFIENKEVMLHKMK